MTIEIMYSLIPFLAYFGAGVTTIHIINKRGFNIFDRLDEIGIHPAAQGIIFIMLTILWPIFAGIMIHAMIKSKLASYEIEGSEYD